MKTTIRRKLFLFFVGFMLLFILLGTAMNALFLEKFYVYKNKEIFENIGLQIAGEYAQNKNGIADYIQMIDRLDGINIYITEKDNGILYSSFPNQSNTTETKLPKEIADMVAANRQGLKSNSVYTLLEQQADQSSKLLYISSLPGQEFLIMTKPVKGILESSHISNQFYLFSGFLMTLIGCIFMFLMTKRMTKPIVEMSLIAENISKLNFEDKIQYAAKDEIGALSQSMNTISERLKVSIEKLKGDIEFQKGLTRNISHELKTPIGVIKGYAEGLQFGVADNQEMSEKYCRVIVDECDRMNGMVTELLDLSMLESGSPTVMKTNKFQLSALIESLSKRFAPIFNEQGINWRTVSDDGLEVEGDFELLERALSNVVMNAVKYNDESKSVMLEARGMDDIIQISIFNTGQPIPGEDLPKIWDVFYKTDKARSRKVGGHGLGLPIVKSIVQLHDGQVKAENDGNGVRVTIQIPAVKARK